MIKYAKSRGDVLLVGIDSDSRVKSLKGPNRPYNNEEDRKRFLESIRYVDQVFVFESEDDMIRILKENNVDLIVVGEEYKNGHVTGSGVCDVDYFPRIGNYSTTRIINGDILGDI